MNETNTTSEKSPRKTGKQIAAITCIVLLVVMYLITFLSACLNFPGWDRLFACCLLLTVALPILLWIFIWLYGKYTEKHTMASLDMMHSDSCTGTNRNPEDRKEK
jgi:protein-S-isoprenylcysteine O-methyltransferase Ste14